MRLRQLILSAAMALGTLGTVGQTHYKPHISIGGRAGVSMAEMSFSPSVKQSWNLASTGAFTFRYTEEKLFGFIAELGWCQRGWRENYEELPFSYSRTLTYLQLPVLTHIYFGSSRAKAFINLGPQIDFLVASSISANFDYRNTAAIPEYPKTRQTEQLYADVSNKFDYGISASAGGEFYISPRNSLVLEARFYFGLGNIFPASKADTFSASRNMSLEFTLGYNFRLK